ncbi:MAG TPA: hypothetical protein VGA52_14300 [Anaerolineales bacterium]|jgi:hypothetical protein
MTDQTSPLVECHSGFVYADRPTALHWDGERLEVEEIEAQWRIPGGRRFRVRTTDQRLFELFYGELYDEWRIHPL